MIQSTLPYLLFKDSDILYKNVKDVDSSIWTGMSRSKQAPDSIICKCTGASIIASLREVAIFCTGRWDILGDATSDSLTFNPTRWLAYG